MEKPLEPPPPLYDPFHPRDAYLARVDNIAPLEKPDPFAGCKNGSDRLLRMIDMTEGTTFGACHLFTRP